MDTSLSSKKRVIVFLAILFAFNLVMILFSPFSLKDYQRLQSDSKIPYLVRWATHPMGIGVCMAIAIGLWVFYLSPLRKRFNEQGQIYFFGFAWAAAGALILRTLSLILGKG